MRLKLGKVIFDPQEGFGSVPDQMEIEYKGFAVIMQPKTFNRLVKPLRQEFVDSEYIVAMYEKMAAGSAVAPPYLIVDFNNRTGARVIGHEGRHRTLAIQSMTRNSPTEQKMLVHVFLSGGMRARHLTADMIEAFRQKAFPQESSRSITGPLFERKVWFNSQWLDLEHDLEKPELPSAGTPVLAAVEKRLAVYLTRKGVRI